MEVHYIFARIKDRHPYTIRTSDPIGSKELKSMLDNRLWRLVNVTSNKYEAERTFDSLQSMGHANKDAQKIATNIVYWMPIIGIILAMIKFRPLPRFDFVTNFRFKFYYIMWFIFSMLSFVVSFFGILFITITH